MINRFALLFITISASLGAAPPVAAQSKDIDALINQLDADLDLDMLYFVKNTIETTTMLAPMCQTAHPGRWPDPSGDLVWKSGSFKLLQTRLAECSKNYDRFYAYLAGQVPSQTALLQRIVSLMEEDIAAKKEELLYGEQGLLRDARGISYSCATMLSITELCPQAVHTN